MLVTPHSGPVSFFSSSLINVLYKQPQNSMWNSSTSLAEVGASIFFILKFYPSVFLKLSSASIILFLIVTIGYTEQYWLWYSFPLCSSVSHMFALVYVTLWKENVGKTQEIRCKYKFESHWNSEYIAKYLLCRHFMCTNITWYGNSSVMCHWIYWKSKIFTQKRILILL